MTTTRAPRVNYAGSVFATGWGVISSSAVFAVGGGLALACIAALVVYWWVTLLVLALIFLLCLPGFIDRRRKRLAMERERDARHFAKYGRAPRPYGHKPW